MSTARHAAHTGGTPPHKAKVTATSSSFIPRFLLKESIVAGPDYNRWLFPPAALLVHFSIGQAYAYRYGLSWDKAAPENGHPPPPGRNLKTRVLPEG
jgi:hypothetical protein